MIERALPSARGFTSPVDPAALARHLASIAKALDAGALTRAQLLGLYLPFNELTQRQLERLRKGARLDKRSFNPVEPRDERGRWTAGVPFAATSAGSSPRSGRRDRANSRGDAARQSPSEREHLAIYPSLDEAAKGAIPGAIAAAQKDRDEHDEYAVSIFPVKGGFSFDGPHLVLLDEDNKGNFTAASNRTGKWRYQDQPASTRWLGDLSMTQSIANLITVHSKEERLRSVMKTLVLALLALASLCGAPGACWALHDQFGAEMMQQNRFVASAAEFDQKRVWVCAGLVFEDGVAQLGWAPGFPNEPKVCVEPVPTSNDPYGAGRISILRQFDHTRTICVHGIYRRDPKPRCPNGVIFAASLGMSFE